jgi:hypothetical protein
MRSMVEGPGAAGLNIKRSSATSPGPSVSPNGLPPLRTGEDWAQENPANRSRCEQAKYHPLRAFARNQQTVMRSDVYSGVIAGGTGTPAKTHIDL